MCEVIAPSSYQFTALSEVVAVEESASRFLHFIDSYGMLIKKAFLTLMGYYPKIIQVNIDYFKIF